MLVKTLCIPFVYMHMSVAAKMHLFEVFIYVFFRIIIYLDKRTIPPFNKMLCIIQRPQNEAKF